LYSAPLHSADNHYEAGVVPIRAAISAIRRCLATSPAARLLHKSAAAESAGLSLGSLDWTTSSLQALGDDLLELIASEAGHGKSDPDGQDPVVDRLQSVYLQQPEPTVPVDRILQLFMQYWSDESSRIDHIIHLQRRLGVNSSALDKFESSLARSLRTAIGPYLQVPQDLIEKSSGSGPLVSSKLSALAAGKWQMPSSVSMQAEQDLSATSIDWLSDHTI